MNSWLGATLDHLKFTGFALTGAHASLDCTSCHVGGRYQGTPANCFSCHTVDYNTTSNPNHQQVGFSTDCQTCHSTVSWPNVIWSGSSFNHSALTNFPLTGAHVTLPCTSCHVDRPQASAKFANAQFAGTPMDCYSCHIKDYNGVADPNHVQAGFPTNCQLCHSTASWVGATIDHSAFTTFPLTGAHASVACSACHINGKFAGTATDCYSCHVKDYNGATDPNHAQAGMPTTCQSCHTTATWGGASFNHNTMTPFQLTGAHVNVACSSCHVNGQFAGTVQTCVGCHLKDFNGTNDPNHLQAAFATIIPDSATLSEVRVRLLGIPSEISHQP
jgi:hypothetical protein